MKFILALLFIGLVSSYTPAPAAEIPVSSQRTLRQQVNIYLELLDKETDKAKLRKDKIDALKRVSAQIQDLARESRNASMEDRQYSESLLAGFKLIPSDKKFKTKNCDSYHEDLTQLAQTMGQSESAKEALAPSQKFLQSACQ